MSPEEYSIYIRSEIDEMMRFRVQEAARTKEGIDRNALALAWIEQHAAEFRQLWPLPLDSRKTV